MGKSSNCGFISGEGESVGHNVSLSEGLAVLRSPSKSLKVIAELQISMPLPCSPYYLPKLNRKKFVEMSVQYITGGDCILIVILLYTLVTLDATNTICTTNLYH